MPSRAPSRDRTQTMRPRSLSSGKSLVGSAPTAEENVPVHAWQKQELDRRKARWQEGSGKGMTWDDVKRLARGRHGR